MADITYVTIPEMTAATAENLSDNMLFETSVPDQSASSGYSSKKVTRGQILSALKEDLNNKANVIISSASGSIAHFEDGAEANAVSVIAHIETVQDLHGYDRPWAGGAGKNKLPLPVANTVNGLTLVHNSDGSVTITGTATANTYFDFFSGDFDSTAFAGYRFVASVTNRPSSGVSFRVSGSDRVSLQEFNNNGTIADNGTGLYFAIRISSGVAISSDGMNIKPMIISSSETDTFSPYSNICPISGHDSVEVTRTGKNLANSAEWVRKAYSSDAESTIRGRLFVGAFPVGTRISISVDADFLATYKYAVHNMIKPYPLSSSSQMIDSGWKTTSTYQLDTVNKYIGLCVSRKDNGEIDLDDLKAQTIMLNIGTPVDYVPFTGFETYTTDLGGTYYGGTLDVVSGVLTVDRAIMTLDGTQNAWMNAGANYYQFNYNLSEAVNSADAITDKFQKIQLSERGTKSGLISYSTDNIFRFALNSDFGITTLAEWRSWLANNPIQLCYELATPQTIQLTPRQVALLVGTNNVWSDVNGDTDVTYKADTKLYIEQLTKPTEDDMVANTAIQSGKFFMVGNRLFLSTSVIASGDTINPGTNCTELSLADALNNLN